MAFRINRLGRSRFGSGEISLRRDTLRATMSHAFSEYASVTGYSPPERIVERGPDCGTPRASNCYRAHHSCTDAGRPGTLARFRPASSQDFRKATLVGV